MFQTDHAAMQRVAQEETKTSTDTLSATSLRILDYLQERGYPLPELTNQSIAAEILRVRALENHAENTMFKTDQAAMQRVAQEESKTASATLSASSQHILDYLQ